ncbi:MAG: hypothetical protein Q8R72_00415 [Hylemonella sp.]|nr:hypothetical protein [Hylemonella sp.]
MTQKTPEQLAAEGYIGTSPEKLSEKSDPELAIWQKGWKAESAEYILADREWQRRLSMRQLDAQFRLEERLATANRWWTMAATAIGVVGTLAGAWFGAYWASEYSTPCASKGTAAIVQPSTPGNDTKTLQP